MIHRHITAISQDAAAAVRYDLKCTGQKRKKNKKTTHKHSPELRASHCIPQGRITKP